MEQGFTFHMDLMKSEGSNDEDRVIRGMSSCEVTDLQNEVMFQKGMDCGPALKSGWINWDHMPGPENLIGIPLKLEIADIQEHPVMKKSGLKGLGCYTEARLLKGHPRAEAVWSLANAIKGTERSLAWSVQGNVLERGGPTNNYLTKSVIRHLAITHQPVLQVSFAEVAKSLTTMNAAPLALEQIDAGEVNVDEVNTLLFGYCKDTHYKSNRFQNGIKGAIEHLMHCKGESLAASKAFLAECIKSNFVKF